MSLYSTFASNVPHVEYLEERASIITNLDELPAIFGKAATLSGAMTATVEKFVISGSADSGILSFLSISAVDATARDIRVRVFIDNDSNACLDVSFSTSAAGAGIVSIGVYNSSKGILVFEPIQYKQSWSLYITSSLTETNKIAVVTNDTWTTRLY